jgi:RimJ/RimL family protein N-acetyltransferase
MLLDAPLRGPRVTLRNLEPADAGGPYLRWMADPNVLRYLEARFARQDRASLEAFIRDANASTSALLLGIVLTAEDRHIGNIKLGSIDPHHHRGDIGILIGDTSAWGHGYAAEAIGLVCDHAFSRLGLHKVTAGFYGAHKGSIRAFEKAGFRVEGRLASHWWCEGAWQDGVVMGLLNPAYDRAR